MTDIIRQTLSLALLMTSACPVAAAAQNRAGAETYTCEGTMARVVRSDFTGEQRNEWQVNFRMNVNRAAGSVMIFAVSGTSIIKPGRHTLAAQQGRMALSWNWIDQGNESQPVAMTIAKDGAFSGSWAESNPLKQNPFGALIRMSIRGSFSGVCWQ